MLHEQDEATLLKIFPTEIWLLILEHVKDAKDYQKFCSASLYFRKLLLPRATQLLFPQVVKSILLHTQTNLTGNSDILVSRLVSKYRGVCKEWRNGIDHKLQIQHFNLHSKSDYRKLTNTYLAFNFDKFVSSTDFAKFEQQFMATHQESQANPFLCRGVIFSIFEDADQRFVDEYGPLEDYYRAWTQLLETYGHHISSCVITLDQRFLDVQEIQEFYQKLKELLRLMQNLQMLEVRILTEELERHDKESIETDVIRSPFPNLAELRFLALPGVHPAAVRLLLQANPQVETINATNDCSREVMETTLAHATNVKFLLLQPLDKASLDAFCVARKVSAPLENLWLAANDLNNRGQPYDWKLIFMAIQSNFGEGLKELRLSLPNVDALRLEGDLTLLHLKILELEMEDLVPLDFLLSINNTLEQLSVRTFESSTHWLSRSQLSIVKLYEFWTRPEMSNVWELFPKLRLLRTGKRGKDGVWYSCTRGQWRNRQAT